MGEQLGARLSGTTKVSCVPEEFAETFEAATRLPNRIVLPVGVKPEPVIVTCVPPCASEVATPCVGDRDIMLGVFVFIWLLVTVIVSLARILVAMSQWIGVA